MFVNDFLFIALPLKKLTQRKVMFECSQACEKVFQDKLTSAPVLTLPEGN